MLISVVFLVVALIARPFRHTFHHVIYIAISAAYVLIFLLTFTVFLMQTVDACLQNSSSCTMHSVFSVHKPDRYILAIIVLAFSVAALTTLTSIARLVVQRAQARRQQEHARRIEQGRGMMNNPPQADWFLEKGNKYCCFISHFKEESGSEARYLSDLIRRMVHTPVFLDSESLIDTRLIFKQGVHASDVFLLLATRSVLMRPWCLLEIWEAYRQEKPIIVLPVNPSRMRDAPRGYTNEHARQHVRDLENRLPKEALEKVYKHLELSGVHDIEVFKVSLLKALGLSEDRPRGASVPDVDRQVLASSFAHASILHAPISPRAHSMLSHMFHHVSPDAVWSHFDEQRQRWAEQLRQRWAEQHQRSEPECHRVDGHTTVDATLGYGE